VSTQTREAPQARKTRTAIVDCDVHNELPSADALDPYLSRRWLEHHKTYGFRGHAGDSYPRLHPRAARTDSWPPSGLPPGADMDFVREQLLDQWNIEFAVLNLVRPVFVGDMLNLGYAEAIARAMNDWQLSQWVAHEPRVRASMAISYEDADAAVAEIERVGDDPGVVQVLIVARTSEPLGRRKYWKIYEAASRRGLPIGIHFGGAGGGPITGAGFPSFYIEEHAGMATAFQDQVTSLVCEGVFERFPDLKIVLTEGGFGWLPPLMWRLDRAWKKLRSEVPDLKRLPSEYIREHIYLTTQPMEEPTNSAHFHDVLAQLDMDDHLLFATDYPHWDFDAPDRALPVKLAPDLTRRIMGDNARALYRFEAGRAGA
jgi:hypothetical protein